jgi:hypothetical protein
LAIEDQKAIKERIEEADEGEEQSEDDLQLKSKKVKFEDQVK